MKITKKALLIIVLFMMGISLLGCGGNFSTNTPAANQPSVTQAPSQTTPQQTNQNQQSPKTDTDWQHVGEGNNPNYGTFCDYVDKNTIVKDGDSITFWMMTRYQTMTDSAILHEDRPKKWMEKHKLLMKSQEYVVLENNSYDEKDKEVFHQKYGENGLEAISITKASPSLKQAIDFVIKNAKEGTDTGEKPNPTYKAQK